MAKGFETPKNYEREKRQLMKAIERRDISAVISLSEKFQQQMGEKRLTQLLVKPEFLTNLLYEQ